MNFSLDPVIKVSQKIGVITAQFSIMTSGRFLLSNASDRETIEKGQKTPPNPPN